MSVCLYFMHFCTIHTIAMHISQWASGTSRTLMNKIERNKCYTSYIYCVLDFMISFVIFYVRVCYKSDQIRDEILLEVIEYTPAIVSGTVQSELD